MSSETYIKNVFFMLSRLTYPAIQEIMESFYTTLKMEYPDYYVKDGLIDIESYNTILHKNLKNAWVRKSFGEEYKFDDGDDTYSIGLWSNGCLVDIGMFDGFWYLNIDGIGELSTQQLSVIKPIIRKYKLKNIK
jgi:hypothetical protein